MQQGRHNEENQIFKIGNANIECKEYEKFFEMWVSNNLKWTPICLCKRNQCLYTLRNMEQVVPRSLLNFLADGISMSKLRYGLVVFWPIRHKDGDQHPSNINVIIAFFNKILILLYGALKKDKISIKKMLNKLKWPRSV